MKHLIFALCLVASFAQAQVSQRYAARIYRIGDQLIIADSVGGNQTVYPFTVAQIVATNSLVRVNISGLSKYYVPAKILNSSGVAYSTTSTTAAVAGILATVPDGTVPTSVTQIGGVKLIDFNDNKTATDQAIQLKVSYVSSVSDLSTSNASSVIVRDANRGGTFTYKPGSFTVDNGITFAGSGGIYERQFIGDIFLRWYGAKGDGATDDANAINAALQGCYWYRYIAGIGQLGGNVRADAGSYFIGNAKRIVIPNRVALKGAGRRVSTFFINSGYKVSASDTIVFEMSNRLQPGGKTNIFHTKLEDLSLNMNGAVGVVGAYSEEINEGSGIFNVGFFNIQYKGFRVFAPFPSTGFGPQNFGIEHCEFIYNNAETSSSRMLEIDLNGATFQTITSNSFVGKNATGYGAEISRASGWSAMNTHVEGLNRGFSIAATGQCFGFTISGIDAQNTMGTSVYMRGIYDSYAYALLSIRSSGGGFAIQDFRNQPTGKINIPGPMAFYSVGSEGYNGTANRSIVSSNAKYARRVYQTGTGTPALTDLVDGEVILWKNTTDNTKKFYVRDGSTITTIP